MISSTKPEVHITYRNDAGAEEDRATAIGNMHIKFGKDRACGSGDILTDKRTDKHTDKQIHTQTCSSQYFATAPAGEVLNGDGDKLFANHAET